MTTRAKPYIITAPIQATTAEAIDSNFDALFQDLATLAATVSTLQAALAVPAVANALLVTDASGVPSWATTLPAAMLPANVLTE